MLEQRVTEWTEQWKREGLQEGRKKGLQEGRKKGLQEGEARLLSRQLERRFGELPAWVGQRLESADAGRLLEWGERVLTASSLEEALGDDRDSDRR